MRTSTKRRSVAPKSSAAENKKSDARRRSMVAKPETVLVVHSPPMRARTRRQSMALNAKVNISPMKNLAQHLSVVDEDHAIDFGKVKPAQSKVPKLTKTKTPSKRESAPSVNTESFTSADVSHKRTKLVENPSPSGMPSPTKQANKTPSVSKKSTSATKKGKSSSKASQVGVKAVEHAVSIPAVRTALPMMETYTDSKKASLISKAVAHAVMKVTPTVAQATPIIAEATSAAVKVTPITATSTVQKTESFIATPKLKKQSKYVADLTPKITPAAVKKAKTVMTSSPAALKTTPLAKSVTQIPRKSTPKSSKKLPSAKTPAAASHTANATSDRKKSTPVDKAISSARSKDTTSPVRMRASEGNIPTPTPTLASPKTALLSPAVKKSKKERKSLAAITKASSVVMSATPPAKYVTHISRKATPKSAMKSTSAKTPVTPTPSVNANTNRRKTTPANKAISTVGSNATPVRMRASEGATCTPTPKVLSEKKVSRTPAAETRRSAPDPDAITELIESGIIIATANRSVVRKRQSSSKAVTPVPKKVVRKATPNRLSAVPASLRPQVKVATPGMAAGDGDHSLLYCTPEIQAETRRAGNTPFHTPLVASKVLNNARKSAKKLPSPTVNDSSMFTDDSSMMSEYDSQLQSPEVPAAAKSWCSIM